MLFKFALPGSEEIDCNEGDQVRILNNDGEWCKVRNLRSSREGFIPSSYLAKIGSLESKP